MSKIVLFVDDEPAMLHAAERLMIDSPARIMTVSSPLAALEVVYREKVAVIVSDNQMPGLLGIELLDQVRKLSPETVRILMTEYVDLAAALSAINRGEVYRFIVKPWVNDELVETVHTALTRYRTLQVLRSEDESILMSLAQTIELKDPHTRGHCERVAAYAQLLAEELGLHPEFVRHIRHGCWLHDCGKIGVPEAILNYTGKIEGDQVDTIRQHPVWGAKVARQAQLSEMVVNIVLYHHEHFDGSGYPNGLAGTAIPLEARIVAVADVYDALTTDRPYRTALTAEKARETMGSLRGTDLDAELVDKFLSRLSNTGHAKHGATRKAVCREPAE